MSKNKVHIITDSTANFYAAAGENLTILPITVSFGQESFLDGVGMSHHEFYARMEVSKDLPTTSQITPFTFEETFESVLAGGQEVVCITISSELSGTYANACAAAAQFPGRVTVIDSQSVAVGSGALVEYALSVASGGADAAQVVQAVEKAKERLKVVALLDTLEYLKRGGRISKTVAFAGGLLSIKPVVSMKGGAVTVLAKARGNHNGNLSMVKELEAMGGIDFAYPVLLGFTGTTDAMIHTFLADSQSLWKDHPDQPPVTTIGGAVGVHVGPNAICLAFFHN